MDEQKKPDEQQIPEEPSVPSEQIPEIKEDEVSQAEEPQQVAQPTAAPTQAYIPRSSAGEEQKHSKWQKLKDFIVECKRVVRITKKPGKDEFKTIVKISGIGMAVIGFLGFFITLIKELFF